MMFFNSIQKREMSKRRRITPGRVIVSVLGTKDLDSEESHWIVRTLNNDSKLIKKETAIRNIGDAMEKGYDAPMYTIETVGKRRLYNVKTEKVYKMVKFVGFKQTELVELKDLPDEPQMSPEEIAKIQCFRCKTLKDC